jgi:hypothetical protein
MERMQARIGKLCRRLGGAWSVSACDLPAKPKWMRWATYRRMEAQAWAAEAIIAAELAPVVVRLCRRVNGGDAQAQSDIAPEVRI